MQKFIKVNESSIENITLEEFLLSYKGANVCDIYNGELSEKLLSNYGVYILNETQKPDEEDGYIIEEGIPKCIAGKWIQTWIKKEINTK